MHWSRKRLPPGNLDPNLSVIFPAVAICSLFACQRRPKSFFPAYLYSLSCDTLRSSWTRPVPGHRTSRRDRRDRVRAGANRVTLPVCLPLARVRRRTSRSFSDNETFFSSFPPLVKSLLCPRLYQACLVCLVHASFPSRCHDDR